MLDPKREELVAKAISMALEGDAQMMRALLDRLAPAPRSQHEAVSVPGLAEAGTLSDKAAAILNAAGAAQITPDVAGLLLGAIANACRIVETDELRRRIDELEMQALERSGLV